MLQERVSNPGPLTYESGTLPIALRGPALGYVTLKEVCSINFSIQPSSTYTGILMGFL